MTFSVMAIIILSYPRKSMFEFWGVGGGPRNVSSKRCIIEILAENREHFFCIMYLQNLLVWNNPEEHPS